MKSQVMNRRRHDDHWSTEEYLTHSANNGYRRPWWWRLFDRLANVVMWPLMVFAVWLFSRPKRKIDWWGVAAVVFTLVIFAGTIVGLIYIFAEYYLPVRGQL